MEDDLDVMMVAMVVEQLVLSKTKEDLDRVAMKVNDTKINEETLTMLRTLWKARKRHLERNKSDAANALGQGSEATTT